MKKILLLLLFSFSFINAQNENKKKKDLIIKNNIKEIITYQYNQKGDSIKTGIDIYDAKGNHKEDLRVKGDKVIFKYLIEHNDKNQMIKQVGYNDEGNISSILLYEYDDNGNQTSYKQVKEDGKILNQQKRLYNNKNQNTELHNFNKKTNDFYLSYKYTYNDNNQYKTIESFNAHKKLTSSAEYFYENGFLIKYISKRNGKKYKTSYENNSKGLLIEKKYFRKRNVILNGEKTVLKQWEEKFQYNTKDNLISKVSSGNGTAFKIEKYFYTKH